MKMATVLNEEFSGSVPLLAAVHAHGPRCGHVAIAHLSDTGSVHLGFVKEDGEVECFAPLTMEAEAPHGSLDNVCLTSEEGTLKVHRKSRQCQTRGQCSTIPHRYDLLPVREPSAMCSSLFGHHQAISSSRHSACSKVAATAHSVAHDEFERIIRHENHADALVNRTDGSMEIHCRKPEDSGACHVTAVLSQYKKLNDTTFDAGLAPVVGRLVDWDELFVFPDQTATSVIKITSGFCCKKESAKIESVLFEEDASSGQGVHYKTFIDNKHKTVTLWHGSDVVHVISRMKRICAFLEQAGFISEIAQIAGFVIEKCEFEVEFEHHGKEEGSRGASASSNVASEVISHSSPFGDTNGIFYPVDRVPQLSVPFLDKEARLDRMVRNTMSLSYRMVGSVKADTEHLSSDQERHVTWKDDMHAATFGALNLANLRKASIKGDQDQCDKTDKCGDISCTKNCADDSKAVPHGEDDANFAVKLLEAVSGLTGILDVSWSDHVLVTKQMSSATHSVIDVCASSSAVSALLVRFNGSQVLKESIDVKSGFCCKKELPKLIRTVAPVLEETPSILQVKGIPNAKRVEFAFVREEERSHLRNALMDALEHDGFVCEHLAMEPSPKPTVIHTELEIEPVETLLLTSSSTVKSTLSVEGVCCQQEVPSVISICNSVPGVISARVLIVTKQVLIEHDPKDNQVALRVAKSLTDEYFPSEVITNGAQELSPLLAQAKEATSSTKPRCSFYGLAWHTMLATLLWLVSWLSYVDSMDYLKYLSVVAVGLGLPKILLKGLRSLWRRRILDVNLLMSIAVIGALGIQDFHEAASVTVIFSWSDWLEQRASRKAKNALLSLMELKPEGAHLESGEQIPVEQVAIGQVVVVRTGDKIPVDGELLSAICEVDESNLTGESKPVYRTKGETLSAGTINVSQFWIRLRATAKSSDSAVSRMIQLVQEASLSRSPTEKLVDSVAKYYTPLVVLMALLMATIPWASGPTVGEFWLKTGLTLLVVACPCALIISTPIAYVAALAQAARFGIVVKGGKYLETLARVRVVACDKTGTLTRGVFEVDDSIVLVDGQDWSEPIVYALLRDIERHATHPIAQALSRYAEAKLLATAPDSFLSLEVLATEIIPGHGVKCSLKNGITVFVVDDSMRIQLCDGKDDLPAQAQAWKEQQSVGVTFTWMVVDKVGVVLGVASSDQVKQTAKAAVHDLTSQLGLKVVVLTGDGSNAGNMLHEMIPEISSIHTGLKPNEKVDHITKLKQKDGKAVLMVGDGVNDAPALSAADIGLAMGVGGSPLALETADCALMDNDLTKIARLIRLSRRTRRKIIENLVFSLLTKVVMLGLTIAGFVTLAVAIAVDVGSMLIVTLNGVSLLEASSPSESTGNPRRRLCCFFNRTITQPEGADSSV